jgi:hypothetical protein
MVLLKNNSQYDDSSCLKIWDSARKNVDRVLLSQSCAICGSRHVNFAEGEIITFLNYKDNSIKVKFKAECLYKHISIGEFVISKDVIEDLLD